MSALSSDSTAAALAAPAPTRRAAGAVLQRIARDPMGLLGLVLVLAVVFTGLFADLLTPYDPLKLLVPDKLQGPSWAHLLGTDHLGRDLLSRVIKGSQIALFFAIVATAISLVIGLTLGLLSGYGPRWLDNLFILLFDTVNAFPRVMLALAVVTLLGSSWATVMLVIVISTSPGYARLVRTATMSVKASDFILAERSLGAGLPRILLRHLLPNIIGPLLILASMDVPVVISIEAGLTFLGLGVPPPAPSWGRILDEGYDYIRETPWIVIAGGIPLILSTLGFTFLGESLRDQFDPKLRRSI